jgi:hypothetical protein
VRELAGLGFGVADLKRRHGAMQHLFAAGSGFQGARGAAAREGDDGYEEATEAKEAKVVLGTRRRGGELRLRPPRALLASVLACRGR